jgi:hypothetical protein
MGSRQSKCLISGDSAREEERGGLTLVSHKIVRPAERLLTAAFVGAGKRFGRVRSVRSDVRLCERRVYGNGLGCVSFERMVDQEREG